MTKLEGSNVEEEKEKQKDGRVRNWAFVQYDDSAPENWRDKLDDLKVPWCESPLHDSDFKENGEPDKPHRHIIIKFANKKSYEQVCEISNLISGTKPERVANMKGYVRYLAHLDNDDKAKYSTEDIICHCGFDKDPYLNMSSSDVKGHLKNIFKYIRANKIESFSDFIDISMEEDLDDWFEVSTMKHTLAVKEYIKSYAYKHTEIDPETGEAHYVGEYLWKKEGFRK